MGSRDSEARERHRSRTSPDGSLVRGQATHSRLEEIGFRLFLMGGMAWLLSRSTDDRRSVFLVALAVSALVFGPLHLLRPPAGLLDATVVVLKAGTAGLLLGWVFWRWGLPYSIVCHGTTNGVHLLAVPLFF